MMQLTKTLYMVPSEDLQVELLELCHSGCRVDHVIRVSDFIRRDLGPTALASWLIVYTESTSVKLSGGRK